MKKKQTDKEKRRMPRIDLEIKIVRADKDMGWTTTNISVGGCFVETKALLPRNREYYPLQFELPDNDFVINALGKVKHYGPKKEGMGIQFWGMGGKGRKMLVKFIQSQIEQPIVDSFL